MDPLGKGLDSLIPDNSITNSADTEGATAATAALPAVEEALPSERDSIFWIEVDKVDPNPFSRDGNSIPRHCRIWLIRSASTLSYSPFLFR